MEKLEMINARGIMENYGFSEYQSKQLIRKSKVLLIQLGYEYYNNRRVGRVPHDIVKKIIGIV